MIPLAMETALGAERFSPLAVAVIGGMTASTFLTLIVVPVLYDAFEDIRQGLRRKKAVPLKEAAFKRRYSPMILINTRLRRRPSNSP
jgi:hypothetical protein